MFEEDCSERDFQIAKEGEKIILFYLGENEKNAPSGNRETVNFPPLLFFF